MEEEEEQKEGEKEMKEEEEKMEGEEEQKDKLQCCD